MFEVTRYRPAWKDSDHDEVRKPKAAKTPRPRKTRKPRVSKQYGLTPAQNRWLLAAWELRQKLTDEAIAARLGLTKQQVMRQLRRVRGAMRKGQ